MAGGRPGARPLLGLATTQRSRTHSASAVALAIASPPNLAFPAFPVPPCLALHSLHSPVPVRGRPTNRTNERTNFGARAC